MYIGYACINTVLQNQGIQCSRGMIKKTFLSKGKDYASELSLLNCKDLLSVIKWNNENNIKIFRITSELFPWNSEYELESLKDFDEIKETLNLVGSEAKKNNQRLTFHPGPFNVLGSEKQNVIESTIKELNNHSKVMDLMGLSKTPFNKINIHIGGAYGNKESTAKRFIENFSKLNDSTKSRLTLENDDKKNLYSVLDLYNLIYKFTNIPIVYDCHHHEVGSNSGMTHKEALHLAFSTWGNIKPVVHLSNSATLEGKKAPMAAHSDYIYSKFDCDNLDVDIMIEAKMKEQSVFKYIKDFLT